MKIVCCSNMPFAKEAFSTLGTVFSKDGRMLTPDDVRDAEILAVRSTTKIDSRLLAGSKVRFAGTATIGTDHMDIPWMEKNGIKWCFAPGCNAESVSEYFAAAILCIADRYDLRLEGKTIGVIGIGNTGSRVVEKALALGMRVLQNDPPRKERENLDFVEIEKILSESDIISLHVPLSKEGKHPTFRMCNAAFFSKLKKNCIFINASRGGVIDTDALLKAREKEIVSRTIIDTWENEPEIRADMLKVADIATPHIAGHSFEGKVMGTVMIYREAAKFLGKSADWDHEPLMPPAIVPEIKLDVSGMTDEKALWKIVRQIYDIEQDDKALRSGSGSKHFDGLRKNYPVRREFHYTQVKALNASGRLLKKISGLGFIAHSD